MLKILIKWNPFYSSIYILLVQLYQLLSYFRAIIKFLYCYRFHIRFIIFWYTAFRVALNCTIGIIWQNLTKWVAKRMLLLRIFKNREPIFRDKNTKILLNTSFTLNHCISRKLLHISWQIVKFRASYETQWTLIVFDSSNSLTFLAKNTLFTVRAHLRLFG